MKRFTVLMLAVVTLLAVTSVSIQARALRVPYVYPEIQSALAIASADSSDIVYVWAPNTLEAYGTFEMELGVPVLAPGDTIPIVDASDTTDYAVEFPLYATGTTSLEGFELRGGNVATVKVRGSGRVKDCTIRVEDTPTDYGIHFHGGSGVISDCNIFIDDTGVTTSGIYLEDFTGAVEGATVEIRNGTSGDWGIEGSLYTDANVAECFVKVPDGGGIYLQDGWVHSTTVDSTTGAGIDVTDADASASHCIATNSSGGAEIRGNGGNVDYCIAYPTGFSGVTFGTGNSVDDPLFCGSGDYTLRVDSYGNPENNASGDQIGLFGVACMYGTLARDAIFAGSGTLAMLDSVVVPAGKDLTLKAATTVDVDAFYPPVPLRVFGTLHLEGEDGDEVVFRSSESLEGYWQGIRTEEDAKAWLEHATVSHGVYGLDVNWSDSVLVSNCAFTANSNCDIRLTSINADSGMCAIIEDSEIDVGGGSGINLIDHSSGVVLSGNTITGDGTSTAGIISGNMFADTLTIEGNTIEEFSNGWGVWLDCGTPTFVGNTVQNSKYGFAILGGAPKVGTSSSSSDNTIAGNVTGIQHDAATAVILNNQINSNTYGVVNKTGDPNLGGRDGVGNGNNTLTNNTTYCLWNRSRSNADTIWAQGNYYGACTAGQPPWCWNGLVVYTAALCSAPAAVVTDIVEVSGEPKGFRLLGAWPNPMTAANEITFSLEAGTARVGVQIFDVAGRLVRDLPGLEYGPGEHTVHWDGRNEFGAPVQSGIYFIRLAGSNGLNATAKVLVAR